MLTPPLARFGPVLATALTLGFARTAGANGNVTHQWITKTAIAATPKGGSLAALLSDPALVNQLYTGTMFPDWGYVPTATKDERTAGEASHWEPVQEAYRRWIVATFPRPWSEEARRHVAFYLGMTSHGMADQAYDSMFFARSIRYDAHAHDSFDQDTDVLWAFGKGPGTVPKRWVPNEPLLGIFADVAHVTIDATALDGRVQTIGAAIAGVNYLSGIGSNVADAESRFPWAAAHDDDPTVPGNPPGEAAVVTRYLRSNWALLHGDALPSPVLFTYPADGATGHALDPSSMESWVSVVFARGLDRSKLDASSFHLTTASGVAVPTSIDLFYGDGSHVVHVMPAASLAADTTYELRVDPGIATIHGESLAGYAFAFATSGPAPAPRNDDSIFTTPDGYLDEAPDAGVDASPADATTNDAGDATLDAVATEDAATEAAAPSAAGDDAGSGCALAPKTRHGAHGARAIVATLLAAAALGRSRRRRPA